MSKPRVDRPFLRKYWSPVVAVAFVVVAFVAVFAGPVLGRTQEREPAGSWPVTLSYDVFYTEMETLAGETPKLTRASLDLEVASEWQSWRQVGICCDGLTGYVKEFRADGSLWVGEVGNSLEQIATHRTDKLLPIIDFVPSYPSTRRALDADDRVVVVGDARRSIDINEGLEVLDDVSSKLRIDATELIAYIVGDELKSLRVVLLPLNLTLRVDEWDENGDLLRRFEVTRIEFGS